METRTDYVITHAGSNDIDFSTGVQVVTEYTCCPTLGGIVGARACYNIGTNKNTKRGRRRERAKKLAAAKKLWGRYNHHLLVMPKQKWKEVKEENAISPFNYLSGIAMPDGGLLSLDGIHASR